LTAVISFVLGALGQYLIERIADDAISSVSPDIEIQIGTPLEPNFSVVVPKTVRLESVRIPFEADAIDRWATNSGGGPAGESVVGLTVWGNKDRPIILTGVRATIGECRPAPPWVLIQRTGGGEIGTRLIKIDLDSEDLDGVPFEDQVTGEDFRFPLQVSKSEAERFQIATSTSKDCTFDIELGYEDGGNVTYRRVGTFRVLSSSQTVEVFHWKQGDDGMATVERGE
jgi:hypothetical protein